MMNVPSNEEMRKRQRAEPCLLLDANIPNYVYHGLKRRGFRVIAVGRDITQRLPDRYILKIAEQRNCLIITKDHDFDGKPNAVYVPHNWFEKYNSWEIVTKIIKKTFTYLQTHSQQTV